MCERYTRSNSGITVRRFGRRQLLRNFRRASLYSDGVFSAFPCNTGHHTNNSDPEMVTSTKKSDKKTTKAMTSDRTTVKVLEYNEGIGEMNSFYSAHIYETELICMCRHFLNVPLFNHLQDYLSRLHSTFIFISETKKGRANYVRHIRGSDSAIETLDWLLFHLYYFF